MKKLITKKYVNKIRFYQMPKIFFTNPKYMSMRAESKLAYMLIMDLVSLSIKNNWINEKDEVFVKLPRAKLMNLLNIKGTQKFAQVMKELVEMELIVYKKIGLAKCNEIYLYLPDEIEDLKTNHRLSETQTYIKTYPTKNNITKTHINQSVIQPIKKTDWPTEQYISEQNLKTDIEAVNRILTNQIHIEDLKDQHDDEFVDEIANNIFEMYLATSSRVGKQDKPRIIIRNVIGKLRMHHIEHVIKQFEKVSGDQEIRNIKGYIQTMIYNSVYEANARIKGHISYNLGY